MPSDLLEITATHEAGHAVMRWLYGHPATELTAGEGDGFCAGSGKRINAGHQLRITLAGYAAELGYCILEPLDVRSGVNWQADGQNDFKDARQLLEDREHLRKVIVVVDGRPQLADVLDSLQWHFEEACAELCPYGHIVEELAERLAKTGKLTARCVGGILRKHDR